MAVFFVIYLLMSCTYFLFFYNFRLQKRVNLKKRKYTKNCRYMNEMVVGS